jgi:hypothetical protein
MYFFRTKKKKKQSSERVLLIHFLEVVLMFKSSVVLSLVRSIESVLKTDRLAVVSCVSVKFCICQITLFLLQSR